MRDKHTTRSRLILWWAHLVTGRPWLVLIVSAVLALVAITYAVRSLEFHADRSALVDPSLPWQQRYSSYKAQFPRWDDLVVAVDLRASGQETGAAFLRALAGRVSADSTFAGITIGYDRRAVRADALLSRPIEDVRAAVDQISASSPVLGATDIASLVRLSDLLGTNLNAAQQASLEIGRAHV